MPNAITKKIIPPGPWNLLWVLLWLGACSPQLKVGSDVNPEASLNQYASFFPDTKDLFTLRSNPILDSEINKKRLRAVISQVLQDKGYAMRQDKPDLQFDFQTTIQNKQQLQNANPVPAWGFYSIYNPYLNQSYYRQYEEMTLIINLRDIKTQELVWQGWLIGEIDYTKDNWTDKMYPKLMKAFENLPNPGEAAAADQ